MDEFECFSNFGKEVGEECSKEFVGCECKYFENVLSKKTVKTSKNVTIVVSNMSMRINLGNGKCLAVPLSKMIIFSRLDEGDGNTFYFQLESSENETVCIELWCSFANSDDSLFLKKHLDGYWLKKNLISMNYEEEEDNEQMNDIDDKIFTKNCDSVLFKEKRRKLV